MQTIRFTENLSRASQQALEFAGRFVTNTLPHSFRYFVYLNQSFDENPLKTSERIYPNDVTELGERIGPISAEEVVSLLCREEHVPEWIDVIPEQADNTHTYFRLDCCGRFSDQDESLYYRDTDRSPFGCKSPRLPPRWSESDGQFDLNWYLHPTSR
jgi:hypothetical protein